MKRFFACLSKLSSIRSQVVPTLLFLLVFGAGNAWSASADPLNGICGRKVQYNTDSANLQWRVDTVQHTLIITGTGQMRDYSNDPRAPWYPWRDYIQTVSFPNGLINVGAYAMASCGQLTTIIWGNSVERINQYAFSYCSNLTQLDLPNSLTFIDSYAFNSCSQLKTVKMGDHVANINYYAFYYSSKIEEIDFGQSPAVIGNDAFYPANSLITIKSKKIKQIQARAFRFCYNLVNLQLGDSLQSIGIYAFESCSSLKAVHFPASLNSFYGNSFYGCKAMDTITVASANPVYDSRNNCNAAIETATNTVILGCWRTVFPTGTAAIGNEAFDECERLQTLVLPESVQKIGDYAFSNCSNLSSVTLPNSVTDIGCGIFSNCRKITSPVYNSIWFVYLNPDYEGSYTIPGTPEKIACEAFKNCNKLTSVSIPSSVTEIGGKSFRDCSRLQSAPLPANLTELGAESFYNCTSLSSINLPERIKTVYSSTFYNCNSLQSIIIPDSVTRVEQYAFQFCSSLTSITFPAELTYLGGNAIGSCTNLNTINWNVRTYNSVSANSWSDPFNGVRGQITSFSLGDSVHILPANLCYEMTKLSSISLGCNIELIGENAFYGCSNIKSIHWNLRTCPDPDIYTQAPFYSLHDSVAEFTFGDSVQHIPAYLCHSMSRLRQLYIPENVTSIGSFAFRYLGELDSIAVHEDNLYYDSRNDCNALIESSSDILLLGCYKTQIPDDITGVGDCAFRNVHQLQSLELPENVTFVGKEAFNGCHGMKSLTLPEGIVTIDDYAFQDCDSLTTLTLPEQVAFVGFRAFAHCSGLEAITCDAPSPFTIDPTSFSYTTCPVYVPCGQINTYRAAPVWADFGTRLAGQYFLTLTVRPNEYANGTVTVVQQPDCEHSAIIEASPSRGYEFISWQDENGQVFSTNAHYEFELEEDLNLIAVFEKTGQGIEDISEENGTAIWYDIMGHRVSQPSSGVYIVVTGSEARKVLIP